MVREQGWGKAKPRLNKKPPLNAERTRGKTVEGDFCFKKENPKGMVSKNMKEIGKRFWTLGIYHKVVWITKTTGTPRQPFERK